jgi:multiple sugar transport system permease protein
MKESDLPMQKIEIEEGPSIWWTYFQRVLVYLFLTVGVLLVIGPFLWMISTSLTSAMEVFAWPPRLIPSQLRFSNYVEAVTAVDIPRYFLNSLVVTVISTISVLILDSLAGYALAKMRFPGRNALFLFILGTIMIPVQVTMIPLFIMFKRAPLLGGNDILGAGGTGMIDTYAALILPWAATTFGIYLMREFFRMLPSELLDAARVDGCSELKIFWRIYLPLAKPALAAVGLFNFTFVWNDFIWPLILTSTPKMRTLQLGLSSYKSQYFTDWHLLMAATTLTCIPIFVVYLIGQRHFIKGVAMSGLKG